MSPAYYRIMEESPHLRFLGSDPVDYIRRLTHASPQESVMIRAALSVIPLRDLIADGIGTTPFRLSEVAELSAEDTYAIIAAVAIQAGHPQLLRHQPYIPTVP